MKTSLNSPISNTNKLALEQFPSRTLFGNTPEPWAMEMSAEDFEQLCFNISEARQGRFVVPPVEIDTTKKYSLHIARTIANTAYYEPLAKEFVVHSPRHYAQKCGRKLGYLRKDGYRQVKVDQRAYLNHHIVWLWFHGCLPVRLDIDHLNQIRDDNRIENLREATSSRNSRNRKLSVANTTGYTGVTYHKATGKYASRIGPSSDRINLGLFFTAREAHEARVAFLKDHPELGYTENHGK